MESASSPRPGIRRCHGTEAQRCRKSADSHHDTRRLLTDLVQQIFLAHYI